jgi:integrase
VRSCEVLASVLEDYRLTARTPTLEVRRSYWDPNQTKNSKDRTTTWRHPYKSVVKELTAYVKEERPATWRQEMFLSSSARDTPISDDALKQVFQRISRRLGYNIHAHQTRHTWAQRLADSGVSPYALMVAGGWSSLSQVDVYYTANRDAAIKAVADAVVA